MAGQLDELGPTLARAVDDVQRWLVEDSPFDVSRADLDRIRGDIGDAVRPLESSRGAVLSSAIVVVEGLVAVLLGLIVTIFALKDGDRFLAWTNRLVPSHRGAGRRAGR